MHGPVLLKCPFMKLVSEQSRRDNIRGVQTQAGAVYVYIYLITYIPRNIMGQLQTKATAIFSWLEAYGKWAELSFQDMYCTKIQTQNKYQLGSAPRMLGVDLECWK